MLQVGLGDLTPWIFMTIINILNTLKKSCSKESCLTQGFPNAFEPMRTILCDIPSDILKKSTW